MFQAGIIRPAKYSQWLSNIVPVWKKNGKIRVCVDYMNLNAATPKDVYPMPVADMLVDAVAGHELLSFMDGTAGYHQIPVSESDKHKTAFRCLGFTRVFEYNNMSFVYIDDVVVKSKKKEDHIENLRTVFTRMRKHKLRMNPAKCIFGVRAGDFLGFIVHERGIEVTEDKAKAVLDAPAPRNKKELQRLLAQDGDGEGGKKIEHAVYYLSRTLLEAETRYSSIERLCLALYFAGTKLRHYMLSFTTVVVAQIDLVKYMLTRPMLRGRIEWKCTNNQAEYEAIIIGLELLLDLEVTEVEVLGDSLLVINQLKGVYKCNNFTLLPFWERASELLDQFTDVVLDYIPRERNFAANELAQLATGIRLADGVRERILKVQRLTLPSFMARKEVKDDWLVAVIDAIDVDWRQSIIQYLTDPSAPVAKRVIYFATNYVLRGGELLRRAEDGLYLRCIYGAEAKRCLREVHCGYCGSHQAGPKMRWLIRRYGFYWPTMLKDCISFAQGCIKCQMHGPVQHVPDVPLQPIIKPWPGRGWALDFIEEIHPNSSVQHKHILLATDFFTKWVEAIPVKTTSSEVITDFIFKYIIT
ncbi:uncharacterized protein LOC126783909 [Argentina anserina]|uniref:uncharacterized protein LOC126783909 n=1 Tax=Argentina anserina TaxID=57926 RepID=UPI0021765897|nr:uncharacterized protein LOC126783909 [Potentilla anserina]